jgi:hypothetical protein
MAKLIKTDGSVQTIKPLNNETFSLQELQGFVGGYIEIISLKDNTYMVLNEEGKLEGLPINDVATNIWVKNFGQTDYIVGNVLIADNTQIN